jgi:GNAT superfamily N-acetyltransferase
MTEALLQQEEIAWRVRKAYESDIAFIYKSWIDSYADTWDVAKSVFGREYKEVIDCILTYPTSEIAVACKADEPDIIFGYMIYEEQTQIGPYLVHYVYVKEAFRKFGIAKHLIQNLKMKNDFLITHRTDLAKKILKKHPQVVYNPFILFYKGSCES